MNKIFKLIITVCACVFVIVASGYAVMKNLYPLEYTTQVEKYADEFGVDKTLVYAVIKCESNFDDKARSSVGALGLMQITLDTFEWAQQKLDKKVLLSDDELLDADTNIKYGTYLLKLHLDEFGSTEVALAAYHAGRGKVNAWLSDDVISPDGESLAEIPYADTKAYVERVGQTIKIYELLY